MKDVVWSGELELHQIDSQAGVPETMLYAAYVPPGGRCPAG